MEVWRTIDGFENYKVSNLGNVKRLDSLVHQSGKIFKYKGRILKQETVKGYKRVSLSKENKVTRFQVHRLVATAFYMNFNDKKCVNHINGIKTDNRSINLEWVTYSENEKHSYDVLGKITNGIVRRKIPLQDVEKIKNLYKNGLSMRKIAKQYNVSGSTISSLINNKTYVKWV